MQIRQKTQKPLLSRRKMRNLPMKANNEAGVSD